ncbi:putative glycosidase [Flavihumibacter petaseus NBRC 106054]|uniref:Putative glycosidase n=2 Tax=Flavihumibacter TaxID=1004301 RepID=A0A0E9N8I6_9BACT|nr:putative glycosidase [Flavihumibacter petaseus NBRC 106054]
MSHPHFEPLDWVKQTNIYEVNLRQYTPEGTFNAFAKELPRLKDMGAQVIWFMPITPIATEKHKGSLGSYYACSDYMATNPEFGSLDDFKQLVKQAHDLDLKVIIDWVANHTGYGHVWTKTNPEYFKKNEQGQFFDKNGWDDVIDLDYSNIDMRKTMIRAMDFWVKETDIDGFRCDMAMLVPLDFWKDARAALDARKKLFWLAECEEVNYHEAFDATYSWEWMHKTEDFAKGRTDIAGLDSLLHRINEQYPAPAYKVYFTSNHDENSWNGTEFEKYGPAAPALAVFAATWNGIPMVYSGQELPSHKRLKFFDKDPIEWTGKYELHDFYKTLLHLHSTHPALRAGDAAVTTYRLQTNVNDALFGFLRKNGKDEVLVLLNLSNRDNLNVDITDDIVQGKFKEIFSGDEHDFSASRQYTIPAWGYRVFTKS